MEAKDFFRISLFMNDELDSSSKVTPGGSETYSPMNPSLNDATN